MKNELDEIEEMLAGLSQDISGLTKNEEKPKHEAPKEDKEADKTPPELDAEQVMANLKKARLYYDGKQYSMARAMYLMPGVQDMMEAQDFMNLAELYERRNDYTESVRCKERAAEKGDSWAMYDVGNAYYMGSFVEKDLAKAYIWLSKWAYAYRYRLSKDYLKKQYPELYTI